MKTLCVIPARLGSTRLKRKALLEIGDKPMVQWTYEAACRCPDIDKVVVATDSEEIAAVVRSCGGAVEMTSTHIQTGSDRVAVVANRYPEMDVIINLQGDEPTMQPEMLSTLIQPFLEKKNSENSEEVVMSTLAFPLNFETEYDDPAFVKVLIDQAGNAIYFSRSPIPYFRKPFDPLNPAPVWHHMGLYAFRRDFLLTYTQLKQTPLEIAESLEQLRALENGYNIRVCTTEQRTLEVNTQEEFDRAREFLLG